MAEIRTATTTADKTPTEETDITLNFAARMVTGETIASVDSAAVKLDEAVVTVAPDVVVESTSISGQTVTVLVSGGVAKATYKVIVTITTSGPQILQLAGRVRVDNA